MPPPPPYLDRFLAAADEIARSRPEVDADLAREVFAEAATLLDNGLVLDGLDEHDADAVVTGLCSDLGAPDPGQAIRERARAIAANPGDLHDPGGVAGALLITASVFQL